MYRGSLYKKIRILQIKFSFIFIHIEFMICDLSLRSYEIKEESFVFLFSTLFQFSN
jgi:hypothetical protein